jgi:hypothetical protein
VKRSVNDTSSESSTEIGRQWIRTCLEEHRCSYWLELSRNAEQLQVRPSRVIDVGAFAGNCQDVRLVVEGNVSKYVALSHCWGKAPNYTTTSENIDQHKTRILYEDLPKTFKDAIKITRDLGYRYIWIDAICIVQGCEDDWAKEGSKMEAIFSNCVLCISATSGTDGTSGCYSTAATGRHELEPHLIKLASVLSTGKSSTLWIYCEPGVCDEPRPHVPAVIQLSPVATRGWMLQERVLAARTLHLTTEQLVWECGQGFQSQDGLEEWYWHRSLYLEANNEHETGPRLARQLANATGTSGPFDIVWIWYIEVVAKDYSRRLLSVYEDKLPAVSGLARLIARSTHSRYIAGLWEYGLCFGLCWKVNAPAPIRLKASGYRAPSFSWASVDSQVDWLPGICDANVPPSALFTLLGWQSTLATSDQYGRISSAFLSVTGRVKQCRVTPCEVLKYPNDDANASILGAMNKPLPFSRAWMDTAPREESLHIILICAVQDGLNTWTTYALLLEPVAERPEVFRRRGLASLYNEAYDQSLWPGAYVNRTITII